MAKDLKGTADEVLLVLKNFPYGATPEQLEAIICPPSVGLLEGALVYLKDCSPPPIAERDGLYFLTENLREGQANGN